MVDNKQLWDSCLVEIEQTTSKANFITWFKNTHLQKQDLGIAYIGVQNEFIRDWLQNKYEKVVLKTLMNYSNDVRGVKFLIYKTPPKNKVTQKNNIQIFNELPLSETSFINQEDTLNPRYTFKSFVVGSFNELAFAAAQAIINKPGVSYNPFFIYGPSGIGKTHLIQAVGNEIKEKYPHKTVKYTSLERFTIDYINSLRNKNTNEFKQKYRKYDVLIMDDVQFISGREKTQEELFHLFNNFYETNRQIIFSSDKHPNYISGLEDRLKTRFSSGMIVDVTEPDFESRVAIVKSKLSEIGLDLSNDIVEYIASSVSNSIRELEGSLNTIICQAQLKNREISLQEAKNLNKNNIKPKKNISIPEVVKIVSDFYNIDEQSIYEKTRRKEIVKARQVVMFILKEDFNISYPLIGQKLGGKDHTTVIHSCTKIKGELKNNSELIGDLEQIRAMF